MRNELVQTAIDNLLEMFKTQDFPSALSMQIIRRRKGDNPIPSDSWSAGNRWIMLANNTTDGRSFGAWHKVGRRVKPGSNAFYIFAPLTRQIKTEDDDGQESTRPLLIGFRLTPVFRMEDSVGKPLPTPTTYEPATFPPFFDLAEKLGVSSVKYVPFDGRALGSYRPGTKEIQLSEISPGTYFHEIFHHLDSQFQPIRAPRLFEAELIAEFGSGCLSSILGIAGGESSCYRYLRSYAEGKDPESVLRSILTIASRVEQLLNIILDAAGTTAVPAGSKDEAAASIPA